MASATKSITSAVPQLQTTKIRTEQLDSVQAKLRAIRGVALVIASGLDAEQTSAPKTEDLREVFDLIANLAEDAYCETLL